MQRCLLFLIAIGMVAAALGLIPENHAENEPSRSVGLPGAGVVIEAAAYASLQAALDALPEDGGMVRLPPGTFQVQEPLLVAAQDVTIVGAGTATHIQNTNQAGQPALILAPPEGKDKIWRLRLADFRVTGNPESGTGILARDVNELFLDGITVSYHGGDGVLLHNCYEDPRIIGCLITYNQQTGLALDGCHDIVVSANQFEENRDALSCKDGFNLCMTGNCLDDHLRHGVVIENTYGSVLSGNMIEECQGTAVVLDRDCYGIAISANVIAHNFGGGVDLRDAHGCAVSANTFTIVPRRALVVGPQSGRIAVAANSFSDSYVGEGEKRQPDDQAASGVLLEGAAKVNVSSNVFSGLDTEPIARAGDEPRHVLISGNLLTTKDRQEELEIARTNLLAPEEESP